VKILKGAVSGRPRGTTNASKLSKGAKKKRKGEKQYREGKVTEEKKQAANWGPLEPLRGPLLPIVDILRPALSMEALVAILAVMVMLLWLRGPASGAQLGPHIGLSHSERLAAYDVLWAREENEFWDWLEARANVDTVLLRKNSASHTGGSAFSKADRSDTTKHKISERQRNKAADKEIEAKIREEKVGQKEMEEAIQITRDRLQVLEGVVQRKKRAQSAEGRK